MATTYGTTALPGSVVSVVEESTTAVSLAFDNSIAIVGGYDASAGSLTSSEENTAIEIEDVSVAKNTFGEDSELHTQIRLAFANGAGRVVAVPVGESDTTESVSGSGSITLSNPAIDPRFNPEESITGTDTVEATSLDVNIVDGTPSSPSSSNTLNINPQTGEGEFDESSDYDVTYPQGDYSTALDAAAKADVRFVSVCSADESVITDGQTDVTDRADLVDLKRLVGHVPTAVTPSSYNVPFDDQRVVLGAPTYGTSVYGNGLQAFLGPSIAAQMASEPLGSGATGNSLVGFDSLSQDFSVSETTDFGDVADEPDRVTVVRDGLFGIEIVEDRTTSTGDKFGDVYRCEIIDDIAYSLHVVAREFVDGTSPNTVDSRELGLEAPARTVLRGAANESPPLLASVDGSRPYTVSTSAGANDETADMEVGIDVVGLTKTVDVNLGVGAINSFEVE